MATEAASMSASKLTQPATTLWMKLGDNTSTHHGSDMPCSLPPCAPYVPSKQTSVGYLDISRNSETNSITKHTQGQKRGPQHTRPPHAACTQALQGQATKAT